MAINVKNLSQEDQQILKLLDLTEELISLRKYDDAERFLGEIEKYKPHDLNIPFLRGTLLMQKRENDRALDQFMIVYKSKPDFFANLNNIGACYYNLHKYKMAISYYQKALEAAPDVDLIFMMLGVCLMRSGQLDESIAHLRGALLKNPDLVETHSGLLMSMMYSESVSPEELAEESRRYGEKVARIFPRIPIFDNDKTKDRKLKVGYVSQDYRDHPVPYFLDPLLENHDRKNFEVYAYSSTKYFNPVMDRMKTHVDVWQDIHGMSNEQASDLIRKDKIDILIDVAGHTGENNLKVFARKPAPIQVTWLGYPATTGMKTMDYKISDPYVEPPGMGEHLNTETIWRLPNIFCCYQPHEKSPEVIAHPPFEDNGYITFGSFNNFIKVRDPVMAVWGKILKQVPNSRLILEVTGGEDPDLVDLITQRLEKQSCPLDQVIIEPRKRSNQFIIYNKIDIALDPFPTTGGTTTMDTLWMGVPLVTLAGRQFSARMGASILTNAGMPELVAENVEEYVAIAVKLATDKDRLKTLRHNLRERFAASPAMNQKSFAHDMEEAYRGMWKRYCES